MISGNGKGNGGAQFETNVEQMDSLAHSFSRVDYDRDFGAFSHTLLRQSLRRFEIEIKQQQNKKKRVTRNQTKKKRLENSKQTLLEATEQWIGETGITNQSS